MDARKYPDLLHWQYELLYLGEDEHGLWLHLPSGTPGRRGNDPMRRIAPGFVALVPVDDPWVIEFYMNHPQHLVYVNIGSVPVVEDAVVHQIDLDLDVVLTHDRVVAVLDEDEFAEHRVRYGYPPEIVDLALGGAQMARSKLENRDPPFDGIADEWLTRVDPATLA